MWHCVHGWGYCSFLSEPYGGSKLQKSNSGHHFSSTNIPEDSADPTSSPDGPFGPIFSDGGVTRKVQSRTGFPKGTGIFEVPKMRRRGVKRTRTQKFDFIRSSVTKIKPFGVTEPLYQFSKFASGQITTEYMARFFKSCLISSVVCCDFPL